MAVIEQVRGAFVAGEVENGHTTEPSREPGGRRAMGWLRELPDFRDYAPEDAEVRDAIPEQSALAAVGTQKAAAALPKKVDLRKWCSAVEDQRTIGSCTAQAAVGIVEYYQRRAFGKHLNGSRLFVYKATRNLLGWEGDTGAYLRSTMGALKLFGVPPEQYWPYKIGDFEKEPPAFLYALAQSYQAETYFRLDPSGKTRADVLKSIKEHLHAGVPSMFGFSVYDSLWSADATGAIPYPERNDRQEGGHAVVAIGYDDAKAIKHPQAAKATKGAFLIRNSWGAGWGDRGYGWLPYEFVHQGLAVDWWVVTKSEWLDTAAFRE